MAKNTEAFSPEPGDSTGEYFTTATPLHAVRPGYIRRAADDALYEAVRAGKHAHVIAPNRTGKSSLVAATSARLQNNGFKIAILDLAQIRDRDGGNDAGRWYYSIAYRLLRQLRLKINLQAWWQDKSILSNRQRLVEFYAEVILQHVPEPVAIFVDEIQCVAGKPLGSHLLASIRAAHNARVAEPDFVRLSFVLAGECDPLSMTADSSLCPFAVSQEIRLGDFTRDDLDTFATELNLLSGDAAIALDRIYYWTSGHPYLTQKLARAVARERISGNIKEHVDRIAWHRLAGRAALHSEPHMIHIHRRIVSDRKNSEALLNLYGRMRKGIEVQFDPESRHERMLMSAGLVVVGESGRLKPRNRLYKAVFTARWANENLPLHWRGPAIVLAILLAVTAIPFAYTQLLPKPYVQVMSSTGTDLESVHNAYVNLASFPGHAGAAERLFRNQLEVRARQTEDTREMQEIDRYARLMPGSATFADELLADFHDRQSSRALQFERRDEALLSAIESLVVSTPVRRRRAASLLGDDYPLLLATIAAQDAERVMFDPDSLVATFVTGSVMHQWALIDDTLRGRPPWAISALEVTPLVRRVVVDRTGQVERIGLTVNVAHTRLDDIRLKLIAPSGRAVELAFDEPSSGSDEFARIEPAQLADLLGEPVAGTWTLSLRDEATGTSGHLIGWELSLNSRVVEEHFERGLDIPDPVARMSDNIWFSPGGKFAISRAAQSDSARLWNLSNAQAERTIAVPAHEQVLGLTGNADLLITTAQNSVHLWSTADGRRHSSIDVGAASPDVMLTADGHHALVQHHGDSNTRYELWSLLDGKVLARLSVAGAPPLVAMDATGTHLAVADYDRAVRVWHLPDKRLIAQIALDAEASQISLSATGDTLGVVYGGSGIALWRTSAPEDPIVAERGAGDWQLQFSPSGDKVIAGTNRQGFQVYRTSDGALAGAPLGAGSTQGPGKLLAFSRDENRVVTGSPRGETRFWNSPVTPVIGAHGSAETVTGGHRLWRRSGDAVSALGPGGKRIAIGDSAGHVHVLHVDASAEELAEAGDELNFLGHRSKVSDITFSREGSLVASAGTAGSIRIWDTETGLPRPYQGGGTARAVDQMEFSPSGERLAVLGAHRVWLMDVQTGAVLADIDLGELHYSIAFADDDRLFVGGESGTLRTLAVDRTGNWNLRNAWTGPAPLRNVGISPRKNLLVIVDATNKAQLLNLETGRIGASTLQLPDAVNEVIFSPNETRVLMRTARWIHRASVSSAGLTWLDAVRTPKAMTGSQMVFESGAPAAPQGEEPAVADPLGNRVLLLTRDAGFAEVAVVDFAYETGPTVFGTREQLLAEWRGKLGLESPSRAIAALR
jgi:WD40 repeat protein/subtilisin-like proprotein convertase family protein